MKAVFGFGQIFLFLIGLIAFYFVLRYLQGASYAGFRGEAIGGRTGGDAYSGGDAELQPGTF